MYSQEFMAYLAAYQKEEKHEVEQKSENPIISLLKFFFKTCLNG